MLSLSTVVSLPLVTYDNYLIFFLFDKKFSFLFCDLGGYDGNSFSSVVEVYDPEKDQWIYGTALTRERSGHGCALTVEPSLDNEE